MKKFIFYLFGIFILIQTNVIACNYVISSFGSSKEQLEKNIGDKFPVNFIQNQFGGEVHFLPIENIIFFPTNLGGIGIPSNILFSRLKLYINS